MKKLILCDLDNTLLPIITQEKFAEMWFRDMAKQFHEQNLNQAVGLNAMNEGCRAMLFNDGEKKNIDVFYDVACAISGYDRTTLDHVASRYYATDFLNVKALTRHNPYAKKIVELMRKKSEILVLATMPMFPIEACDTRMRWVDLNAGMFDLVTTADFSSFCKPDPRYFSEILDYYGIRPKDALMIGNDVREDMQPCESLGIETFLVTNYMITHDLDHTRYRQGDYPALIAFLEDL